MGDAVKGKNYYPGVDVLRVLAAFGIVGCHLDLRSMTEGAWFVKRFTDYNVGVFAALSGFFFFGLTCLSFGDYIKKRVVRLLIPYIIWTMIFLIVGNAFHLFSRGCLDVDLLTWTRLKQVIFFGGASAHLWFVVSLFYVQCLLFCLVRRRVSGCLLLIASLAIIFVSDYFGSWYAKYPCRLLGFVLTGGWLRSMYDGAGSAFGSSFRVKVLNLVLLIVGIVGTATDDRFRYFWECVLSLPLCVMAVASNSERLKRHAVGLRKLGDMTFLIFLVHPIFTVFLREIVCRVFPIQGVMVFLIDQTVAFLMSLAFACVVYRLMGSCAFLGCLIGKIGDPVKRRVRACPNEGGELCHGRV